MIPAPDDEPSHSAHVQFSAARIHYAWHPAFDKEVEVQYRASRRGVGVRICVMEDQSGLVIPEFSLVDEVQAIQQLMRTYRNIPMSLADACLVRMAEIHERSVVMTLDSDFVVYRKSRRKVVPLLRPER